MRGPSPLAGRVEATAETPSTSQMRRDLPRPSEHCARPAQGRLSGLPPKNDAKMRERIRKLAGSGDYTRGEIAEMVQVSRATLYRALQSL